MLEMTRKWAPMAAAIYGLLALPNSGFCATEVPLVLSGPGLNGPDLPRVELKAASKATIVAFVSSRCPCSASHELELKRLSALYTPQGFQFVGVHSNQNEPIAEAQAHFKLVSFSFPVIHDERAALADQLGALKTPHVYVINPEGKVLYQGGVDDSHIQQTASKHYLADALNSISAGKDPQPSRTRSLGCVISRKP